ncbi:MAG: alpha/beta hydrolase [Bacteroidales bacterium]|nr:alpha/beta hydrolase [Bacteroidales bacterium]
MKRFISLLAIVLLTLPPANARIRSRRTKIERSDGKRMGLLILRPGDGADTLRTGILWIHGGGYISGMKSMARWVGRPKPLVEKYGAVVVSPGYRLSFQNPYPAAIEDCYDALKWMVAHAAELGIRSDQIFVGGESAGGGLTAALCILARDRGEVRIAYQMPLYPMLDDRDTDSSRDNHNKVWNTQLNHFGWEQYLGGLYGTDNVPPYAAAARETDYRGLPPAYTFVCTGEPFYCETLTYIENLKKAGIEADCDVFEGLYHAFDIYQPDIQESRQATESFERHFLHAREHFFAPQEK